ncbi:hypothetical protein IV203_000995 [Nitzschia inconspicua]|uniref:Uncharacterized protein n=1 Tax=Nitzschia inconspicua TaxID=303405 RepID=A0A9K3PT40_9STRA|nr:hypothetical protein IV203_000995 [Nitzschia inconspicua]
MPADPRKQDAENRWKSKGWEPLKYPRSALMDQCSYDLSVDRFLAAIPSSIFPLHTDVILAAVRELLILEGCLNPMNLTVNDSAVVREIIAQDTIKTSPQCTFSGEDVAYSILFHLIEASCSVKTNKTESNVSMEQQQPIPCTVSGTDLTGLSTSSTATNESTGQDSLMFSARGEHALPKIRQLLEKMIQDSKGEATNPDEETMIHLSILDEVVFRKAAAEMLRPLITLFSDRSLGLFFGYKRGCGKHRHRVADMLGDFLFDVSHAMYAFEHTHREVLAYESGTFDASTNNIDKYHDSARMILESLMVDDRSVKKIGGINDASILLHAISIAYDCQNNNAWCHFATTFRGKKMLAHHESVKAMVSVGSVRRAGRLLVPRLKTPANSILLQSEGCSSVDLDANHSPHMASLSWVTPEKPWEGGGENLDGKGFIPLDGKMCQAVLARTQWATRITICRESCQSKWGVGLVQEGPVCVVEKVRHRCGIGEQNLKCGDLILFAENEVGKVAFTPSIPCCPSGQIENHFDTNEEWFRGMIDLFKVSRALNLVVRRAV